MNPQTEKIYTPNPNVGGFWGAYAKAFADLHASRHLIFRLFIRDFNAQFRQKILGYLWILIGPLVNIFGFILMNSVGILNPGDTGIPYPLYVLLGTTLWGVMEGALSVVSGGLQQQADLIVRTGVPKIALALCSLFNHLYHHLIQYIVIILLSVAFSVFPNWGALFYIPFLIPLLLFGIGIGLVLAVVGVIAKDISPMFLAGFRLFMYATPVIYVSKNIDNEILREIIRWNPLTYIIEAPRTLFYSGSYDAWHAYALSVAFCVAIFSIGLFLFYLLQDKVAERL